MLGIPPRPASLPNQYARWELVLSTSRRARSRCCSVADVDRDELVRRACDGDPAARDELGVLLHRKLKMYFGHREATAEMLQDTMVDVWTKAACEAPRTADAFVGWVLSYAGTIVRRTNGERYREYVRACKREHMPAPPSPVSPSSEVRRAQRLQLLARCMKQLRTHDRNAVQNRLNGGKDQELADREGIPVSTVRSRANRGLAKLKQLIGDARVTRTPDR